MTRLQKTDYWNCGDSENGNCSLLVKSVRKPKSCVPMRAMSLPNLYVRVKTFCACLTIQ